MNSVSQPIKSSLHIYAERMAVFAAERESARKSSNLISNTRLGVFLVGLSGFLWSVFQNQVLLALFIVLVGTVTFIFLMARHEKINVRERLAAQLTGINEAGLQRLDGRWTQFSMDGNEYLDEAHPYAADLDVFGHASLFQWLNATRTELGRLHLQRILAAPPRPMNEIQADQGMVKELAAKLDWRQRFQAAGRFPEKARATEDPEALFAWAEDPFRLFPNPKLVVMLRVLPAFSLALALFSYFKLESGALMAPAYLLQMAIAAWNERKHGKVLEDLGRRQENLETYRQLARQIESADFTDSGLKDAAGSLRNTSGTWASLALGRLQTLADYTATRRNPVLHFLVNTLFLWDLQWLWAIRSWRRDNGASLRSWLKTIARLESLASLATPAFENPEWVFPEVTGQGPLIQAKLLAHPLLPASARVGNDLNIGQAGEVMIITGSNMSGKSTMMRTVGINLVLAYAGAPVCARNFSCRLLEIHTSMRLRDDLEKRISSFYAELLRIKSIVEAARGGKQVLFLVDEIFRGTNSKDRHAGAMAVLRQLHDLGAAGMVSTHDFELARLEEMQPGSFRNHHFQEHYSDGKIHFDFKMSPGISGTTNAMHLLKMVGLV